MRVSLFNIRGWTAKKSNAVQSLVEAADVTCLTETWTHQALPLSDAYTAHYAHGHRAEKARCHHGGVCRITKDLEFTEIHQQSTPPLPIYRW